MPNREVGERRNGANTDRLLGELIAEVRAVKHATANNTQKLDGVATITASLKEALHRLERLEIEQTLHDTRIAVLEADKNRREGAVGLVEWVARHWPFTVIIAALAGWVAYMNGKVHP